MRKVFYVSIGVLAVFFIAAGVPICQVGVEPPPLPHAPAEATPYEPFLDAGADLSPKDLLAQMNTLYDNLKHQYKCRNYTKLKKRARDLRNMADNLKRKNKETPDPTAFYAAADQLRNWAVKLRDATGRLSGDDMYKAFKRLADRFNNCYKVLGEAKKVSAGPRYDPPVKDSSKAD